MATNLLKHEDKSVFIFKFYISFTHKMNELFYLIFKVFKNVYIMKPNISSLLSSVIIYNIQLKIINSQKNK
jgi:hypothetical protein